MLNMYLHLQYNITLKEMNKQGSLTAADTAMEGKTGIRNLTMNDTQELKGIALIFLLCHHLFYVQKGLYDDYCGLVQNWGIWCKVCVAIFVLLSGYGLTVKANHDHGIPSVRTFYWHRFTKLLSHYWFIWLCFVPLGVFAFGRTFDIVYKFHPTFYFFTDLFGIASCFNVLGYNPTWWFMGCIIVLYLIYPFLYRISRWGNHWLILATVCLYFLPIPHGFLGMEKPYLFSFSMGILLANAWKEDGTALYIGRGASKLYKCSVLIFLLLLAAERHFMVTDKLPFDAVLALMITIAYLSFHIPSFLRKGLNFLGKHSMNIFLFHTFILSYFFQDLIYCTRNCVISFLELLIICIVISVLIEKVKQWIGFYKLLHEVEAWGTSK
jgi:peptidoglycan/LPS O-acetylase OafA/YrhL